MSSFFIQKFFCVAFMCLQCGFVIFWWKDFGAKAAHKMLVKSPRLKFSTFLSGEENFFSYFRISAMFEMRTTLCEIHLWNDPMTGFKSGTKSCGERVGQRKDRMSERVWETVRCWKWEMVWAINLIVGENIYGRCGEDNLRRLRWLLMIVFPWSEYFLCYSIDEISSDRQVATTAKYHSQLVSYWFDFHCSRQKWARLPEQNNSKWSFISFEILFEYNLKPKILFYPQQTVMVLNVGESLPE